MKIQSIWKSIQDFRITGKINLSRAVQSLNIYDNDALDKEEKACEENWERDISTENDFETDSIMMIQTIEYWYLTSNES